MGSDRHLCQPLFRNNTTVWLFKNCSDESLLLSKFVRERRVLTKKRCISEEFPNLCIVYFRNRQLLSACFHPTTALEDLRQMNQIPGTLCYALHRLVSFVYFTCAAIYVRQTHDLRQLIRVVPEYLLAQVTVTGRTLLP